MKIALIATLATLAALNAHASLRCYRDTLFSRGQRVAQIIFIWAVPLVGAALALRLSRNEPERGSGSYAPEKDAGVEYVTGYGRANSQGYISSPDDNFHSTDGGDAAPD